MKRFRKLFCLWFISCLLFLGIHTTTVNADMGPKPQITVVVKNPPTGEYYLDLLIKDEADYENMESDIEGYDKEKLSILQAYNDVNWHPALTKGTKAPMWGDLVGVKKSNHMEHVFGYMGVPDDFKIIIITPDNKVIVTKEIHKSTFDFKVTYDYKTGNIIKENLIVSYIVQFLMSCLPTLFIEAMVLFFFRFNFKKNWKAFLGVNVLTQVFLTATMGTALITGGLISSYLVFIPLEFIILIFETIAYGFLLKEKSVLRRVCYGIVANVVSCITGFLLIIFEFAVHQIL